MHDPIRRLVDELSKLPGIGERTALRLTLHLLEQKQEQALSLADSIKELAMNVKECAVCCNLTAYSDHCTVCQKHGRDDSVVCVVACIQDLMAIETSQIFFGRYHVLHGMLEPINGVGPDRLRIKELMARLEADERIKELILATSASIEGEATALYLREKVGNRALTVTRISSGVPVGGDLQFADRLSLSRALTMRTRFTGAV